jgi:hypothetical protein
MSRSLNCWVTIIRQGRQACDIISSVMGPFACLGNVGLMLLEIPVILPALLVFYSVFMFESKKTRICSALGNRIDETRHAPLFCKETTRMFTITRVNAELSFFFFFFFFFFPSHV